MSVPPVTTGATMVLTTTTQDATSGVAMQRRLGTPAAEHEQSELQSKEDRMQQDLLVYCQLI